MSDSGDVIRYDVNQSSVLTSVKARWIGISAGMLWIVGLIIRHAPVVAFIFPILCFAILLTMSLRGTAIVVDRNEVRMPFRKAVRWSDVDYVEDPGRWGGAITLRLKDGTSRQIGLPPRYTEEVARIGNVPLGDDS